MLGVLGTRNGGVLSAATCGPARPRNRDHVRSLRVLAELVSDHGVQADHSCDVFDSAPWLGGGRSHPASRYRDNPWASCLLRTVAPVRPTLIVFAPAGDSPATASSSGVTRIVSGHEIPAAMDFAACRQWDGPLRRTRCSGPLSADLPVGYWCSDVQPFGAVPGGWIR